MNFLILKTIVDSTIQNYNQQNPHAKIADNNVSITALSDNGVDLMIRSPHLQKEINVRAEVNFMNGPLPTNFSVAGAGLGQFQGVINDNDVIEIREAIKTHATISDLFGDS